MENKDLEKILKDLKSMAKTLEKTKDKEEKEFLKNLDEALKQPCKIHLDKDKNGEAKVQIEGNTKGLLIGLAGLENALLKQLDVPTPVFEMVKGYVGTRRAE